MRPEIVKMVSGKAYRLDEYEGYILSAVGTGFTALLEGLVQENLEATPSTLEWITLTTLTDGTPRARVVETPFIRVTVTSGAATFHLQKLDRIVRPEIIKMVLGKAYRLDEYEGYILSAVGTGFTATLEGLVQENLEATPSTLEWITLTTLTDGTPRARVVETPFIRVNVTSGAAVFHLQKLARLVEAGGGEALEKLVISLGITTAGKTQDQLAAEVTNALARQDVGTHGLIGVPSGTGLGMRRSKPLVRETFATAHGWVNGSGGVYSENTTSFLTGDRSLQVSLDGTVRYMANGVAAPALDYTNYTGAVIRCRLLNAPSNGAVIANLTTLTVEFRVVTPAGGVVNSGNIASFLRLAGSEYGEFESFYIPRWHFFYQAGADVTSLNGNKRIFIGYSGAVGSTLLVDSVEILL